MRVAVPICRGRISPVFDVAQRLFLVDVQENEITSQNEQELRGDHFQTLTEQRVDVLICAAISRELETALLAHGITVFSGICGSTDEVMNAYLLDRLSDGKFAIPGGRHRRRGRHSQSRRSRNGRGVPSVEPLPEGEREVQ